jgi:hypothetical protein
MMRKFGLVAVLSSAARQERERKLKMSDNRVRRFMGKRDIQRVTKFWDFS